MFFIKMYVHLYTVVHQHRANNILNKKNRLKSKLYLMEKHTNLPVNRDKVL